MKELKEGHVTGAWGWGTVVQAEAQEAGRAAQDGFNGKC